MAKTPSRSQGSQRPTRQNNASVCSVSKGTRTTFGYGGKTTPASTTRFQRYHRSKRRRKQYHLRNRNPRSER
ncbi:uncharacterized protein MELLADRAFT_91553 [Melampsora larici-populina 98AG31]|uniref:Uncharacterized protein n=1 Tax=Melampsora larici-populina (strain 98AG31 / pathotype 3-4-7) TaxID=747676 RepID=F4RZG8_MELLP|nr:uncharacterized protein MELLADRAFT_91553 [Melampsora larici-populina 98AG31]EGG02223.1 hypothetical protein MELLADRAFT_91553 [Melampsora larici-populina 98AG31]